MGSGVGGMIDIMFVLSGVYLICTARSAKRKGNVAGNIMLGKDISENDIVDKAGFIAYMYSRILLAGIMIIIAGVIHMVNDWYIYSAVLTWIGIALIVAAMAVYTTAYLQGKKRYMKIEKNDSHKRTGHKK